MKFSKPSFWKVVTAKIPGPLKKMIFEEAKKEAEGKVKMTQMKVFSFKGFNFKIFE